MARGKKGSHTGSLAGGFINGLMSAYKLDMMARYYESQEKYRQWLMDQPRGGHDPGAQKAYDTESKGYKPDTGAGGAGGKVTGKFWTPENQQHAYDTLMKSGKFSEYGAAGAVARMTKEAPDGPTSVNPKSGAFGIAQWLGGRLDAIKGNTNFDDQLKYYAGADLDRPENAKAKEQFKNASSSDEGSIAAMHMERAGGYVESGGKTDALLHQTPTADVYSTVHGGAKGVREAQAGATPAAGTGEKMPAAVASDDDRAYLASRSSHPDRPGDTANLNPTFAKNVSNAIADARMQGLNVGLESGFRKPEQTGTATPAGRFDAEGRSQHTYGMAVDISGLDGPNGPKTKQWAQIADKYGLHNPYGVGNAKESNHWQALPYEFKANDPRLADLQKAYASGDQNAIWKAGDSLMGVGTAGPTQPAVAAKQPEVAPVPPRRPTAPAPAPVVAKPVTPPPLPRRPAPPAPPPPPSTAIASAIPPTAGAAPEAPSPIAPNIPDKAVATGYGPNGSWGPNPPLAERPEQAPTKPPPTPDEQIALASNRGMPSAPGMPDDMAGGMGPPPMMDTSDVDVAEGTGLDFGPGMGMMAAQRGGVVRRYWRGGAVRGYQGGGDIQDPGGSSVGMPPGLAGGSQQTPPIYFNPATYAAAGAPVGKGISATSAPTFTAGAIPSLPMAKGGVVMGFQEGGDVGDIGGDMPDMTYQDAQVTSDLERQVGAGTGAPADPMSSFKQFSWADTTPISQDERGPQLAMNVGRGLSMPSFGGGLRMPSPRMSSGVGLGAPRAAAPKDGPGAFEPNYGVPDDPDHPNHPDHPANDPGLHPSTPQVMDQNGHPSKGLIGAIADGLHYIAHTLGLTPDQQGGAIAGSPDIQANRRNHMDGGVAGVGAMTPEQREEIGDIQDPHHTLDGNLRNIAGLEGVYRYYRDKGDTVNASKMAASILQASTQASMDYGDEAVKRYYKGDAQGALDLVLKAKEQISDGTLIHATISDDGQSVIVSGHKLNGEELWRRVEGPEAILAAARHAQDGSMAWTMYEQAAGKYDPGYQEKAKIRAENVRAEAAEKRQQGALDRQQHAADLRTQEAERKEQAKQDAADREAAAETEMLRQMRPPTAPATSAPAIPAAPAPTPAAQPTAAPAPAPVSGAIPTTPSPAVAAGEQPPTRSPDSTGTAQPATPPPDADTRTGGIPVSPAAMTIPESPEATRLTNTHAANLQEIRANYGYDERTKTFADAPQAMRPPEEYPGYANLTPQGKRSLEVAYQNNVKERQQWTQNRMAQMHQDMQAADRDYATQFAAVKQQEREAYGQKMQGEREAASQRMQAAREAATEQRQQQRPMSPKEIDERFKGTSEEQYLAGSVHSAVPGDTDGKQSLQNLNRMFDLHDKGGVKRVNDMKHALRNTQAYNPNYDPSQLSDYLVGMASNTYEFQSRKGTVDHGYGPMKQVRVFEGKVGDGPGVTMLIPENDFSRIVKIQSEWQAGEKAKAAREEQTSEIGRERQQYPPPPRKMEKYELPLQSPGLGIPPGASWQGP